MNTTLIILIVVVVVLVIALAAAGAMLARRRRSERLQEHYGPEYERTVLETGGDRRSAEQQLAEREERHHELDVRDLDPQEREHFAAAWTDVQRGFVDDPVHAVQRADGLVTEIMRTRGYPVDDFDRRAEDISVEHPQVVQRYREAQEIHTATREGSADTEQQRRAVTSYRELIDALLGHEARRPADGSDNHRHHDTTDRQTEEHTMTSGEHERTGGVRGAINDLLGLGDRRDERDADRREAPDTAPAQDGGQVQDDTALRGDQPYSAQAQGEPAVRGDQPYAGPAHDDTPLRGDQPYAGPAHDDTALRGDQPYGAQAHDDTALRGDQPYGGQAQDDTAVRGEQHYSDQRVGDQVRGEPYSDQSFGDGAPAGVPAQRVDDPGAVRTDRFDAPPGEYGGAVDDGRRSPASGGGLFEREDDGPRGRTDEVGTTGEPVAAPQGTGYAGEPQVHPDAQQSGQAGPRHELLGQDDGTAHDSLQRQVQDERDRPVGHDEAGTSAGTVGAAGAVGAATVHHPAGDDVDAHPGTDQPADTTSATGAPTTSGGAPASVGTDEEGRERLVPAERATDYGTRWDQIKGEFVDEPRQAVAGADTLVGELLDELQTLFAEQRQSLDRGFDDNEASTEDLRLALRRYRSFFDRLLSI